MRIELYLLIILSAFRLIFNDTNSYHIEHAIILDQESELSVTGKLSLIDANMSDLLLIPGIGDKLANEIYMKRYQINDYANLAGMETALTLAKGIGKQNVKSIAKYLR